MSPASQPTDAHSATTDASPILRIRMSGGEITEIQAIDLPGLLDEFADLPDASPAVEILRGLLETGCFDDHTWEAGTVVRYLCERPEALAAQVGT